MEVRALVVFDLTAQFCTEDSDSQWFMYPTDEKEQGISTMRAVHIHFLSALPW